jgi:hypothetical protein
MARRSLLLFVLVALAPAQSRAAGDREFMAKLVARTFFRGLLSGNIEGVLPVCDRRVNLDGQWVTGAEALGTHLRTAAKRARDLGIRLRQVQVMSYREAVRRFGPPPARLRGAVGPGRMVALARFQTLGAVAVLRRVGPFWKVAALTD